MFKCLSLTHLYSHTFTLICTMIGVFYLICFLSLFFAAACCLHSHVSSSFTYHASDQLMMCSHSQCLKLQYLANMSFIRPGAGLDSG